MKFQRSGSRIVEANWVLLGWCCSQFIVGVALLAPFIAPYDPFASVGPPFGAPSVSHILGTNDAGQDIFSELLYGARTSLLVGVSAALIVTALGTFVGLAAAYFGGLIREHTDADN